MSQRALEAEDGVGVGLRDRELRVCARELRRWRTATTGEVRACARELRRRRTSSDSAMRCPQDVLCRGMGGRDASIAGGWTRQLDACVAAIGLFIRDRKSTRLNSSHPV